jgi:hypothetical protein
MSASAGEPSVVDPTAGPSRKAQSIVLPGQAPEGQYILSVLLKRTYDIVPGGRCARAEQDKKLIPGDVHYDDPMNSSVKYETDFIPFKLATDVVINCKAYAPDGAPTFGLAASVFVEQFRKDIWVIGDRLCHYRQGGDPVFGDPEPFNTMDVVYERAYGGVDIYSDPKLPCIYARNRLGRGFVIANTKKSIENLALPNVEDPADPLAPARLCTGHFMHWEYQPMPQGFGWLSKTWQPRASLAGVMPADRAAEQELRKAYSLVIPPEQRELYEQTQLPDMDFRFFNGASLGMVFPFLSGEEKVGLINLTPQGTTWFQLPGEHPRMGLDIGDGVQEPEVVLHTVMVRMEEWQVDLVWRGAAPYPGPDWLPQMRKMEVLFQ